MRLSLSTEALISYFRTQCGRLFPDGGDLDGVERAVETALQRTSHCFARMRAKYYWDGTSPTFNHLNSDQYTIFLYYLSNSAFRANKLEVASKAYLLNKALHAVDIFYEIALPDVWGVRHPVGTVLGRAQYADYFIVYQQCLVGIGLDGRYPLFRGPAVLFGGSKVVGNCEIGENAWISLGTTVLNEDVPAQMVAAGSSPTLALRPTRQDIRASLFGISPETMA